MTVQLSVTYDCLAFHYGTHKEDLLETVSAFQGQELVSFPSTQFRKKSKNGVLLTTHLETLDSHSKHMTYEIYRRAVAARLVVAKKKKQKTSVRGRVTNRRSHAEVAKVQKQLVPQPAAASRKKTVAVASRRPKKPSSLLSSNPFAALADMD